MNFVSLFKGRGKLIKLLKVKCETERKLIGTRHYCKLLCTAWFGPGLGPHLHSKWSILCIDHIRHLVCIECVIFWYPIHTCYVWDQAVQQDFFMQWDWCILYWNIFYISVVILNSNLHYQIFKFVIDNSDISLNCLQHIQKRRNFDAKVTCHQPICLLLHAILSGVGVAWGWPWGIWIINRKDYFGP